MLESQMDWKFTYKDQQTLSQELDRLKLSPLVKQLLAHRGVNTAEQAERFLNPTLDQLHDPGLLEGMHVVKERVNQAIEQGQSILVFGDYDADGVTATSIMVETLHELGAMCDYYIPNRFTEGYGPNADAFREAKRQGFDLVITVDTGIAAFEAAQVAKEIGLDLIITDHHELQEQLPEALAIIHPKYSKDYPFKELAGVGVAFKVAQYLLNYFPKQYLDLVVIGTIADLVPLTGENRILAKFGLQAISQSKRLGLQALKEVASLAGNVTEEDIGFSIGPRINAVGRLETAYPAVELLLTDDPSEAQRIASSINLINQERQSIVNEIVKEAIAMVNQQAEDQRDVIVVAKEEWNEGVLGIVASKLVRTFQRPALCLTIKPDGHAKGSARSVPAFDLFEAGMANRELFVQFGGHAQAAGMTIEQSKINLLRKTLNETAREQLSPDDFREHAEIEVKLDLTQLDLSTIQDIERLAPFGMSNPKPLFYLDGYAVEKRQIGGQKNHLKMIIEQDDHQLAVIGFGFGHHYHRISAHANLEVIGSLQVNEWNGVRTPQMLVRDLRIREWQLFDYRGSKHWQRELNHLEPKNTIYLSFQNQSNDLNGSVLSISEIDKLNLNKINDLVLIDIPDQLDQLTNVLINLQPNNIYACYRVEQDQLFTSIPTRDDFKWLYGFIVQRGRYDRQSDRTQIARFKGWQLSKIDWIIQVFSELEFVKITDGIVHPNQQVIKRDLTESLSYQKALQQQEVEQVLYYSNYLELKTWLESQVGLKNPTEEEMIYGL
ncbi:single-stranded-DNA-specific exonuclease RecJ [Amphibacillus sediminis]|uniref:single-stranded-DNA-specific exonuclease RecJ n=1 Tax=Amphibacillus sediminis TaxID=360185 RepID=UPI000829F28C|nr:single-stranded-DNA-specific exonuclease RecJ [Amphibacillus sediminis]